MREESVARRYAAALFEQAKKTGTVAAAGQDLELVAATVAATPSLRALLAQPLVTQERKSLALEKAFGDKISRAVMAFLYLLVDKRRVNLLPQVQEAFAQMVLDYRNIAHATATSAVPLTPEQAAALEKSLEARTGKDIELQMEVDPALIGGIWVRIGDTVLDGTVRGNLERLREQLLARK
jgi:F-type H+-transporting ATPase subunit delta